MDLVDYGVARIEVRIYSRKTWPIYSGHGGMCPSIYIFRVEQQFCEQFAPSVVLSNNFVEVFLACLYKYKLRYEDNACIDYILHSQQILHKFCSRS